MKNYKSILKRVILAYLLLFSFIRVYNQTVTLDKSYNGLTLEEFADKVEKLYDYSVFFLFDSIPIVYINSIDKDISADKLLEKFNIKYAFDGKKNIFLSKA